jgi:hypothetical protein
MKEIKKEVLFMGYRSQVRICMKKASFEELKQELMGEYAYLIEHLDEYTETTGNYYCGDKTEEVVVFGWDWIKWYEGYEDIQVINSFLDKLSDRDEDYSFIRIGEYIDDTEIYSNSNEGYCDIIHLERSVYID